MSTNTYTNVTRRKSSVRYSNISLVVNGRSPVGLEKIEKSPGSRVLMIAKNESETFLFA